jgi:hypothetical protein
LHPHRKQVRTGSKNGFVMADTVTIPTAGVKRFPTSAADQQPRAPHAPKALRTLVQVLVPLPHVTRPVLALAVAVGRSEVVAPGLLL